MASVTKQALLAILQRVHAPATAANLRFLNAWQQAEGGNAAFNPFNTTQPAGGASNYNSVGVKNYGSMKQGLDATAQTLLNGHYGNIVGDLRSGRASAQQLATDVSHSPWGTGSGVLRVLGASPSKVTGVGPVTYPPTSDGQGGVGPLRKNALVADPKAVIVSTLLQASSDAAQGKTPDFGGILQIAQARQQQQAAQDQFGPSMATGPLRPAKGEGMSLDKGLWTGASLQGEDSSFLGKVQSAALAAGATHIRTTSGRRTEAHNVAVGGAPNSNHLTGHALDGEGFVPGRGWVPLGTLLAPVAPKFGLRSGATFNWGGKPDVVHVDDATNQPKA